MARVMFLEEALVEKYNKENGTHFTEYREVLDNEEKKRREKTIEVLNKLYEITKPRKEVK